MIDILDYVIFDIDGTLANGEHRVHLIKEQGWDAYFNECHNDTPFEHMQLLVSALDAEDDVGARYCNIVLVSGRPERIRARTENWLWTHYNLRDNAPVYMRKDGDHRPDHVIKSEVLDLIVKDYGKPPLMVFDDRNAVVKMWRDKGIPCLQVAEGDF